MMRTTTDRPFFVLTTRTRVPSGRVRCAAVTSALRELQNPALEAGHLGRKLAHAPRQGSRIGIAALGPGCVLVKADAHLLTRRQTVRTRRVTLFCGMSRSKLSGRAIAAETISLAPVSDRLRMRQSSVNWPLLKIIFAAIRVRTRCAPRWLGSSVGAGWLMPPNVGGPF